jgi:hypothetical protein
MQYPSVQFLIEYLLTLQPEYQCFWNTRNTRNTRNRSNITCCYNLDNIPVFAKLKDYMTGQKLLYFDEAEWLEDAIHETLVDDD